MKKKTITKSILAILVVFISLFAYMTVSVNAADDDICADYLEMIEKIVEAMEERGCEIGGTNTGACNTWENLRLYYLELYEENCGQTSDPCVTLFNYEWMNYQYKVDNSPYYVSKIYIKSTGELAFCIEPSATMLDCHDDYYTVSADDLSTEDIIRISLAAMFYLEEPSNTHYVAAHQIEQVWVVDQQET